MSFFDLAVRRRSIRKFLPDPVDPETVEELVRAAGESPSACNSQPWHFVALFDDEIRRKVAAACMTPLVPINRFVPTAPLLVVQVSVTPNPASMIGGLIKHKSFVAMDSGIAAAHFCLAAAERGLGTCLLGWFDEKKIARELDIPKPYRVELVIAVGKPARADAPKARRKSFEQVYSVNRFRMSGPVAPPCETIEGEN